MEIVWETGDRVRETQTQLELSLARDVKDNGKGFHRYIANKRKPRDDVGPLRKETGDLTTLDMKKAEVLNDFCASAINGKFSSQASQVGKGQCWDWESEDPEPAVREDQAQAHLRNLNVLKSMRPDEIHPRVLRELTEEVANQLPIVFENLWQSG